MLKVISRGEKDMVEVIMAFLKGCLWGNTGGMSRKMPKGLLEKVNKLRNKLIQDFKFLERLICGEKGDVVGFSSPLFLQSFLHRSLQGRRGGKGGEGGEIAS